MPYATVAELQDRLGIARLLQLTDRTDPPLGVVDAAVAQGALDDAAAEIDGYLVGRYALPLAPAPAVLRVTALTIAHYRLLGSAAGEVERADYAAATKYLLAVAKGEVQLTLPDVARESVDGVEFVAGEKVMGRGTW